MSLMLGLSLSLTGQNGGGGGSTKVVRGMAQGMQLGIQSMEAGTALWSRLTRTPHRSKKKFSRSKVVIPTFWKTGSLLPETDLAASLKFQVALEVAFTNAVSGLSTNRLPYLFSGQKTVLYNGPGTNPVGYLVSDWLEHTEIAVDAKFGLWTIVENQLGAASPANTLPVMWNTSNYIQKYGGARTNQSGGPYDGISFIDTDAAVVATTVSSFSASQAGGLGGFWPTMMLIEYDSGEQAVAIWADSIGQGTGESVIGSGTNAAPPVYGDSLGSALMNRGYYERAVNEKLGVNPAINLSRGSDKYRYLATDTMTKSLNLLALANPTHLWMGMIHNDVSEGQSVNTFKGYATTVLNRISAAIPNAKIIQSVCTPDAISTRSVTSLTSVSTLCTATVASTADLINGQSVVISGASPSTYNGTFVISNITATTFDYTAGSAPASSPATGTILANNQYLSAAGQTPGFGFGNSSSSRGQANAAIRNKEAPFDRLFKVFDPNLVAEEGYDGTQASETSKWKVDGTPWRWVWDGTHPNSHGTQDIGASAPADLLT